MTYCADGWLRLWPAVFPADVSITEGGLRLPHPLIQSPRSPAFGKGG